MCKENVVGEKCDKCKPGFVAGPNGTLDKDNQICFKAGMSYIILIEVKCIHLLILIFRYKVITVGMVGLIQLGIVVPQVSIKVTLKIKDQEFH